MNTDLTRTEAARLGELEGIVERGLETFDEVAVRTAAQRISETTEAAAA